MQGGVKMKVKKVTGFALSVMVVMACLAPAAALAKVPVPPVSAPACGYCDAVYHKDSNGNWVCQHKPGCPSAPKTNKS